jgi:hypothetical protein
MAYMIGTWLGISEEQINKDLYIAKKTVVLAFSGVDKSVNQSGMTLFGGPVEKWLWLIYLK